MMLSAAALQTVGLGSFAVEETRSVLLKIL